MHRQSIAKKIGHCRQIYFSGEFSACLIQYSDSSWSRRNFLLKKSETSKARKITTKEFLKNFGPRLLARKYFYRQR